MEEIISFGTIIAFILAFVFFLFKEFLKEMIKKSSSNITNESAKKIIKRVSIVSLLILIILGGLYLILSKSMTTDRKCEQIKLCVNKLHSKYEEVFSKYSNELEENKVERIVLNGYQDEVKRLMNFHCDSLIMNERLIQNELDSLEIRLKEITNEITL